MWYVAMCSFFLWRKHFRMISGTLSVRSVAFAWAFPLPGSCFARDHKHCLLVDVSLFFEYNFFSAYGVRERATCVHA